MNLNHEKLQFFGIYEILKETITLIFTPTTIFAQIALAFILPLSLLIFTQSTHSPPFNSLRSFFSAIFFFLSTSTAVYAAACIHADHDVSFRQVIAAAPKVCKRHFITFLCLLADFLAFNFFAVSAILLIFVISFLLNYERFEIFKAALILFLSAAAVYFALIWQIASVVSVFETEAYGFEAIARSKELIEGKMAIGLILLALIGSPFGLILFVIRYCVESALVREGILGIVWMCSFVMFLLIGTVLYLVCKSYHCERIDESALCDCLRGYLPV